MLLVACVWAVRDAVGESGGVGSSEVSKSTSSATYLELWL